MFNGGLTQNLGNQTIAKAVEGNFLWEAKSAYQQSLVMSREKFRVFSPPPGHLELE